MFSAQVYTHRRNKLAGIVKQGLLLILGNTESPINYADNAYRFRQDSSFLYFAGIDLPDLALVIDSDTGKEYLFGNDWDMNMLIWMGEQPTMQQLAANAGIKNVRPFGQLADFLRSSKQTVHYLPPYRDQQRVFLSALLDKSIAIIDADASLVLTKAVIQLREIKEDIEITEIEHAIEISGQMHTEAMRMARVGVNEQEIFAAVQGIAMRGGWGTSFHPIVTINGQTLHNHYAGNTLTNGKLLLVDTGAETNNHYAGDITRTTPVGGHFDTRQREIYEIVLQANFYGVTYAAPHVRNLDLHTEVLRIIAAGLQDVGIVRGNADEAVAAGAIALFMPHGLGHQMGLDVHDLEALGENLVGYDDTVKRSTQFGLRSLRLGKALKVGMVLTIEPGIYFIPALINQWRQERKFEQYINYAKLEEYKNFGGIRIEDDILITPNGCRVLGKHIPKTVDEVESVAQGGF